MPSNLFTQQYVSTTAPIGAVLGDEWLDSTSGKLYKQTLVNGVVSWVNVPIAAGTDFVSPNVATVFTKPQTPSTSVELAPVSGAITWDLTASQILRINLNANITTFNLTGTLINLVSNQYEVIIRYNGGSTVTWNSNFKWTAATAPALTGTGGKIDVLTFVVASTDGVNYYLINTGIKLNVG